MDFSFVELSTSIQTPVSVTFYDFDQKIFIDIPLKDIPKKLGDGCEMFSEGMFILRSSEINESLYQNISKLVAGDISKILKFLPDQYPAVEKFFDAVNIFRNQNTRKLYLSYNKHVGYGVHALETIKKGEIIAFYAGVLTLTNNINDFSYAYTMNEKYNFCIDGRQVRSFGSMLQAAPRLSHAFTSDENAASANALTVSLILQGTPVTAVVATREIAKGHPIFWDYIAQDNYTLCDYWKLKKVIPYALNKFTGEPVVNLETGELVHLQDFSTRELLIAHLYNLIKNGQYFNATAIFQKHALLNNQNEFSVEEKKSYDKILSHIKSTVFFPQSSKELDAIRTNYAQVKNHFFYLQNLFKKRSIKPMDPESASLFVQRLLFERKELSAMNTSDFIMNAQAYFIYGVLHAENKIFSDLAKQYIKAAICILENIDQPVPDTYTQAYADQLNVK